MLKSNGFTLTETLIAFSIVMMLITTAVPIMTLLEKERSNLTMRLSAGSKLHDDLQNKIQGASPGDTSHYTNVINQKKVTFTFTNESERIKGCVSWINERTKQERICLYGLIQE